LSRGAGKRRSVKSHCRPPPPRAGFRRGQGARHLFDEAAEAVTTRGRERIIGAAEFWLASHADDANAEIRFDANLVVPGKMPRHIVNAFDAST
jgi:Holliday junction resolvase-like predicted endonuclease